MPLFSENRENLRLGQFSPVIIRRKRQELAKESVELKDRFRVLSSQQLKRLNQVIAEREAEVPNGIPPVLRNTVGFTTEVSEPTWGETLIKAPASGLAGVNVGLARLAKDVIKIADLPTDVARKVMGMKGERPDIEFLESYIESEKGRQAKLDISEKLRKLPHWHPKRILGTGLQAIPQVVAVAGGALMGAPFIGGATSAATMLGAIAYGPSAEEAKAEGATEIQQILHGVTSAQIEVLTELPVFKAVGQIWKHLKGAGIAKKVGVSFAKRLLTGLGLYGKGLALETTQEVEAYLGGQISKRLHYDPNATINFKDAVEAGYGGLSMAATIGIAGVPAMGVRAVAKTPEARQAIIETEMPEAPMTTISEETTNLASVKPLPAPIRALGMRERPVIEPAPIEPTAEVAREPVGVEKPAIKKEPEAMAKEGLPEYEKEIAGKKVGKAEVKEPWKTDTKLESRKYQEKYPERTVHESWDKANSPRHDFEGAGDILREFQEKDQDSHYISEKLVRVKRFVDGHLNNTLHFDDSLDAAIKHEPKKLNRLISQYESQPVLTESQETAKSLILNIMKGNFKEAENNLNTIENNIEKWTEQALKPLPPKPPKAKPPEVVTAEIEGEVMPEPIPKVEKIELKELQAIKTKKEGAEIVRSDTYETQEEFLTRIIKEKDLEVDNTHDIRPEDLTLQEYADSVNKNELETWVDGLGMEDSPPKFSSPADLKITYEHPEATREEIERIKRGEAKPKPEKEKIEVTPEKKEPWEMTRDDYVKQYIEEQRAADFPEHMITDKYKESIMRDHFAVVSEAFAGDKTIPPKVLKDYPDLKAEKKVEVETTPEGKEISIDLTKKEEAAVTPKQQKEYLLAEIDKAIESGLKESEFEGSLEEARELRKGRYALNPLGDVKTNYTFEVPNDGTFEILGSQLFEFQSRVKSAFPATIISKQFKPKVPTKKAIPAVKYNKIIVVPPKELKPADIDRIFKEVADTEARDITGAVLLNPFQNWLLSQDITKAVKDKIKSVAGKDYIDEARIAIEKRDIGYAREMVEYTRGEFEELQSYYEKYKEGEKTLKQITEETGIKQSGNELAQEASDAKSAYYDAVAHLEKLEKPTDVEVLSETKSHLIENIKSEKGESILINDLARLGTDAIKRGHESFKAFSAQMEITLSEVWDKIKHLMREAYEAAKVVLKSERGEVALRPKKLTAAEKMLGIRKPKAKDIIEIYKEKHIALKPKRLRLTKETAKDFIAKVYTKFVFKEYPAIRLALKAKDPKVVQRVQDQINRVWGKGGIVEVFVAGKGPHRLDAEGKPVYIKDMQSLKEIVKDLNPQEYEDYETLRIAERDVALARFRPDITGTDIKSSSEVIEAIERKYGEGIKKLRDISKAQRKYDDILLQLLVEEGWLSKKIYETIKARPESEFYASFVREMESVGEQVLGGKDPLKKIRGSELRKMPTIESSISNTYKTIKLLETIKLNKEIAKLKDLTPDLAEIIKEVKPHYIPVKQTLEAEIDPKMKRELDEVTKGLGATVETLKKVGRSKLGQFIHEMRGLGLTDEESNRIELKFATTEKTYAHELGHLIDRKFDLQTLLIKGKGEEYPVIKKELRKIADQRAADDVSAHYKKYIRKRTEQVAEFVARYLTQPDQARELAPAAVRKLEAFFNSKSQLKKLLAIRPSGQATLAKMSDVLFAKSPIPPKNTIIVPVNGMKHYWQIPADVHKAINYYSPQEMSMVIKILSWPAQTLRAGATLTAEFIMRNPARDQFTAMVYSKYGYIPMWDLSKGFFELMKKGDLYQEFKAGGGEQSYFTSMDRTTLNLTARDIVGFKKGLKTYNPIEYLRIASEAMEKATRLGIFKRARNKGATVPQATAAARESTLDFRRIGEERRINQIIAFWNANVQGIDIMRRKLYKHPGRTLLRLTMGITLPSIALWLFNNSDDERKKRYNALPGWRKNFFWNIIIEDTPIISLPKPFELGLIFGSLPERILDYIALNDPKELKTIAQSIKDGAMPGLIPTAALPILENLTNWSFFMERPIESETIKRLPPGQRAHQYTSTVLKKFGKATNLSPIKLENWIRGWTGGLGKLGLDITDPLFETDEIPEVTKHWYEVTPGLRGFVAKEPIGGAGKDIANFYDNLEKITQAEQGFKLLFKTDKEEADKFNKKTKGIKGFAASFRKTSRKLGKLRKRKSVIMESKEYTSDKKRELVDEIDERMTEIARARNETLLKPKQPISGMVPWKTKRKKKPAWQKSVGFGKKPSWQTSVF